MSVAVKVRRSELVRDWPERGCPDREQVRSYRPWFAPVHLCCLALSTLILLACERPSPPPPAQGPPPPQRLERELDARTEVLHQTREVIRYVEEEERLREQESRQRGLEPSR